MHNTYFYTLDDDDILLLMIAAHVLFTVLYCAPLLPADFH